jgi:hypothetical protein
MKTKKNLFALMLALVLMVMCTLPVMAAADAAPTSGAAQMEQAEQLEIDAPADAGDADPEAALDTPVVTSHTEEETPTAPEGEAAGEEVEPEQPEEKKGNTAYFIGAGIAVLLFIGVAFYCRANGKK